MVPAPPGWYPDPSRTSAWRWWDGSRWTDHLYPPHQAPVPPSTAPVSPSAPTATLTGAWRAEERISSWARACVIAYCVLTVAGLVAFLVFGASLRHEFRQVFHDVASGRTAQNRAPLPSSAAVDAFDLLIVPTQVVFLVWQYRAAKVARLLGYPGRVSPALGVGAWFIPIANFWLPYWSLRDCLPADHRARRFGLWAWLAYLMATVANSAAIVTAFFSVGWAVLPLALGAVAWTTAAVVGTRVMSAIAEDHRGTVGT